MTQLGVNKSDLFLTLIVYYTSLDEAIYVYRRNILENNNKKIEKKNSKNLTVTYFLIFHQKYKPSDND